MNIRAYLFIELLMISLCLGCAQTERYIQPSKTAVKKENGWRAQHKITEYDVPLAGGVVMIDEREILDTGRVPLAINAFVYINGEEYGTERDHSLKSNYDQYHQLKYFTEPRQNDVIGNWYRLTYSDDSHHLKIKLGKNKSGMPRSIFVEIPYGKMGEHFDYYYFYSIRQTGKY